MVFIGRRQSFIWWKLHAYYCLNRITHFQKAHQKNGFDMSLFGEWQSKSFHAFMGWNYLKFVENVWTGQTAIQFIGKYRMKLFQTTARRTNNRKQKKKARECLPTAYVCGWKRNWTRKIEYLWKRMKQYFAAEMAIAKRRPFWRMKIQHNKTMCTWIQKTENVKNLLPMVKVKETMHLVWYLYQCGVRASHIHLLFVDFHVNHACNKQNAV